MTAARYPAIQELRQFLAAQKAGRIADLPALIERLTEAWDALDGADDHAMGARKLQRVEKAWWEPPLLSFQIERHGGTVAGSSRAEVQAWVIDVDAGTARAATAGQRQLGLMRKSLDTSQIAREVAAAIAAGRDEPWLRWSADRTAVRILSSRLVNPDRAPSQTVRGRSQRLRAALLPELERVGWRLGRQAGGFERVGVAD